MTEVRIPFFHLSMQVSNNYFDELGGLGQQLFHFIRGRCTSKYYDDQIKMPHICGVFMVEKCVSKYMPRGFWGLSYSILDNYLKGHLWAY